MTQKPSKDAVSRTDNYEVGYGRPPKATQFKPGQSGNPKGRKRKPKSVRAQLQGILANKVSITEQGRQKRLSMEEVILRTLVNKAAKGDLRAAELVMRWRDAPEIEEATNLDQVPLSAADKALLLGALETATAGENESAAAPDDMPTGMYDTGSKE